MNALDQAQIWHELGPFTLWDTETTGLSPVHHRIVEIAAIRVNTDGTREVFESLINPERTIPPQVSRVHGITNAHVVHSPKFHEIAPDFMRFIEGSTLVAHNARFDLSFLQESLARCGLEPWNGKAMDSIPVFKQVFPGLKSYKLQELRARFNLGTGTEKAHRALGDVEILVEAFAFALNTAIKQGK